MGGKTGKMLEDDTKRIRVGNAINRWGENAWLKNLSLSGPERKSRIIEDIAEWGARLSPYKAAIHEMREYARKYRERRNRLKPK
jgi:hypothetical protein